MAIVEETLYLIIVAVVSALLLVAAFEIFSIEKMWRVVEGIWRDIEEMAAYIKSL